MKNNEYVFNNLMSVIDNMNSNKNDFVKNPDRDFTRNRKLDFKHTIMLILGMNGNTLNKELYDYFGKDPKTIATSSAFIQQRNKITDNTFKHLFNEFNESMIDFKTYKGYKLYAVDGSDINVAYDREADTYMRPQILYTKNGDESRGYNQIHLNAIYDLVNKVYVNVAFQPRPIANERAAFTEMLESMPLSTKTLFIADRGYPSWNIFAHLKHKENADYLFRVRNDESNLLKELPMMELDVIRKITITTNRAYMKTEGYAYLQPRKKGKTYSDKTNNKPWDFGMFEELTFRIVRFKITEDTYETIMTSLPKDKFSLEEIKKLYGMRWGIETSFRELKYCLGLTNLHCKREDFVMQEIYARLTMYNFTHRIVEMVVVEQDNNRKYSYKVNFTMATRFCVDFFKSLISSIDLYELILKYITPIRAGRTDTRKMKSKTFVGFTYRVA